MEEVKGSIAVGKSEITLTPASHHYTLVWLVGMGEEPQKALDFLLSREILQVLRNFRIVIPRPPRKYVKIINATVPAWFNIKMRGELSFVVDTNEAFEESDIHRSYEDIIRPILEREFARLGSKSDRLFLGGFSQGCAMAYHSLYSCGLPLAGMLGVGGYMFKVTPFSQQNSVPKLHIHGLSDKTREWPHVKICFDGKFKQEETVLIQGMGHQTSRTKTKAQIAKFFQNTLSNIERRPKL